MATPRTAYVGPQGAERTAGEHALMPCPRWAGRQRGLRGKLGGAEVQGAMGTQVARATMRCGAQVMAHAHAHLPCFAIRDPLQPTQQRNEALHRQRARGAAREGDRGTGGMGRDRRGGGSARSVARTTSQHRSGTVMV